MLHSGACTTSRSRRGRANSNLHYLVTNQDGDGKGLLKPSSSSSIEKAKKSVSFAETSETPAPDHDGIIELTVDDSFRHLDGPKGLTGCEGKEAIEVQEQKEMAGLPPPAVIAFSRRSASPLECFQPLRESQKHRRRRTGYGRTGNISTSARGPTACPSATSAKQTGLSKLTV